MLTLYVINYATLIIALFEKLDSIRDSSRTFDDDDKSYYSTSQNSSSLRRPRNSASLFYQVKHYNYFFKLFKCQKKYIQ